MISSDGKISALFLDIGGVLLTNGWDRKIRSQAASKFGLDFDDMDERHHLTFDTYEEGKLTLDEYLDRVVFFQPRAFSRDEFKTFMFENSKPFPEMLSLVREIKERYHLRTVAVSNEGRELTIYRIQKYSLSDILDFFVSSCFVHFRKPDADIYRIALDLVQVPADQIIYVDDRPLFVDVARSLGIKSILHVNVENTRNALKAYELR